MCPPNGNTSRKSVPWPISVVAIVLTAALAPLWGILAYPILHPPRPSHPHVCLSNLKETAKAVLLYTGDWDGHLPSSAVVSGSPKWNRSDFIKFATRTGKPVPGNSRATYREVIYDYAKDKTIFWCPSDPLRDKAEKQSTRSSYYWKLAVYKAWYGEGCSKPYRKIDDYPYPTDTTLLYERQGFHYGNKPLANGTRINVVYLDTHVKNIALTNATSGDPVNCAANADGEPMYFNYDFKTEKGLTSETTPAKWTDPSRYGDKY